MDNGVSLNDDVSYFGITGKDGYGNVF